MLKKFFNKMLRISTKLYLNYASHLDDKEYIDISKVKKYDVVSFDIFDTLLLRKVSNPSIIFDILGEDNNLFNFTKIRMSTEYELRKKNQKEVTLEEIYNELSLILPNSIKLMNDELKLEDKFIIRNDKMFDIYKEVKALGKEVVFISDMYLPEWFIRNKLTECGFDKKDRLYLSSTQRYQKLDGSLFELVKSEYNNKSIIHIGDNYRIDYINARKHSFSSAWYKNIHERWEKKYVPSCSSISGSVYKALSDNVQFCTNNNSMYILGYSFFGFVILGFVKYINELSKLYNAPVLFASRDMKIVQEVYNMIYPEDEAYYIRCSRFSLIRADYLNQEQRFIDWISRCNNKKLCDTLYNINFNFLIDIFKERAFNTDIVINKTNLDIIINELREARKDILVKLSLEHDNAIEYYSKIVGDNKSVIFVDLSGLCTGGIAIQNLLNEQSKVKIINCQLFSGDFGSFISSKVGHSLFPYLCSLKTDKITSTMFKLVGNGNYTEYLESIFSENEGSLISYSNLVNWEMSSEKNDGLALKNIHKGILDFCIDYRNTIGLNYSILRNDAINALLSGLSYFHEMDKNNLIISSNNSQ